MSIPNRSIDLEALARSDSDADAVPAPRRRWLWGLVPILLLAGFGIVFFDSVRTLFEDAVIVTVVRPRPATVDGTTGPGDIVFQTAGWIEPDPFAIRVTALAEGVVAKMLVDEGDTVKPGDPVSELVDDGARLALDRADAKHGKAVAALASAKAEVDNATASFEAALEVTEARDTARADLEARRATLTSRENAVIESQAAIDVAKSELETQRYLRREQAVGPWQVELAEAKLKEAQARRLVREADRASTSAELDHARVGLLKAERDFELRFEERLRVALATAGVPEAEAAVREAAAAVAEARLRLKRMTVISPTGGVVLTRDAQIGSVVGPGATASAVCHLYDPNSLRARVDVQLGQATRASLGQRAEIRCDVRRDKPYTGRVLRVIDRADIQKVTLEVQVRIEDPDGRLKPDMLCHVTAYGKAEANETSEPRATIVRIPTRCLVGENAVWVVDGLTGRATRRSVKTGTRHGDEIYVLQGLNSTDKVVDRGAHGLTEGARVEVEDTR
ncbi:MAG: hypothetical protein CMJ83_03290 [Planctomycetes bacterium]|nr:hypothetical protein [Planctomycetota bacterium]